VPEQQRRSGPGAPPPADLSPPHRRPTRSDAQQARRCLWRHQASSARPSAPVSRRWSAALEREVSTEECVVCFRIMCCLVVHSLGGPQLYTHWLRKPLALLLKMPGKALLGLVFVCRALVGRLILLYPAPHATTSIMSLYHFPSTHHLPWHPGHLAIRIRAYSAVLPRHGSTPCAPSPAGASSIL
jgi:hypothetical protein